MGVRACRCGGTRALVPRRGMRGAGLCSPFLCGLPGGVKAAAPMPSAHLGGLPRVGALAPLQGSP